MEFLGWTDVNFAKLTAPIWLVGLTAIWQVWQLSAGLLLLLFWCYVMPRWCYSASWLLRLGRGWWAWLLSGCWAGLSWAGLAGCPVPSRLCNYWARLHCCTAALAHCSCLWLTGLGLEFAWLGSFASSLDFPSFFQKSWKSSKTFQNVPNSQQNVP